MISGVLCLALAAWPVELQDDLHAALAAVPPAARLPLEVEVHAEARPWGFEYRAGTLHLYAYTEPDDPRALAPLARLSADQRISLWRRRAIVHALIRKWDERLRWSARPAWTWLSSWSVYPWAFSRREGLQSPALDLATFAEELLVPAESMAPDAVPPDERLRCREPSKSRSLDARLAALDPSWRPARDCPAFDAWARGEQLELIFAAPATSGAQSSFGHLLLRLDDERVVQLAALISPLEAPEAYVARGLLGGFRGVFSITSLADVQLEALGLEQRALRRFPLALTPLQRRRVLERVWELERVGYLDYRFFNANCATMLRLLLAPALDGLPAEPLTPFETPTQVLEALRPLLGEVEVDEPGGVVAERAELERRGLLRGTDWSELPAPALYRALSTLEGREAWRARVLLASLRIERHALDVATLARLQVERATVAPGWKGPTTDELLAARQRRSEREPDSRLRARVELADFLALDALLRSAPRRALTNSEQAVLDAEAQARETFELVGAALATLPDDALSEARTDERARQQQLLAETRARAVPEGGHGHASLGFGALSSLEPVLRVRGAFFAEQLGDQRLRGLGASSAWRLLDATLELTPRAPIHRAGLTVLAAQRLGQGGWGGGGALDYAFVDRGHEAVASAELLRRVVSDARLTNFLLLTAGARGGVRWAPSPVGVLTPRLGVAARVQLPGSFGNALRLDAGWTPRLEGRALEQGAMGALQVTVRLGVFGGVAFTARADVQAEWRPSTGVRGLAALGVDLD